MSTLEEQTNALRSTKPAPLRADAADLLWWTPVLLAGAYMVLTPFADGLSSFGLYDTKRLLQIGLLLAGALCTAAVPRLRASWAATLQTLPAAARWGLGVVLALGMASALTAPVPRVALLDVAHYALLFVLGLAAASVCRAAPRRYVQVLLGAVGAGAGLYLLLVAEGYATHVLGGNAALWPAGGDIGFANRRFFNQVQSWVLPLLAVPVMMRVVRRRKWASCLAAGVLAGWWMLLFASGGRGTLLGMFVALVGTGLLFREQAWPWLRVQLAGGAGGALLYGLFFQVIAPARKSIVERAQTKGLASGGRLGDWQAAVEAAWQHPWLGLGPMHTAYAPNGLWPTPHNAVVQSAAEWGLPAALLIVALAGWGLFAWGRRTRLDLLEESTDAPSREAGALLPAARVALTGSLLAAGTHAMVSGVVVMPASQVMMALVLGGALGLHLPRHVPSPGALAPADRTEWAVVVFLAAGAALLVWAVAPEVLTLNVRRAEWIFEVGELRFPPRYWGAGMFGL